MRIACVTAVYPPTRGGMCTVAAAEAEQLAVDNAVMVYTLRTTNNRADTSVDRSSRATIVRLTGLPRIWISGFVPQLLWQLRKEKIIYAHLPAYGFMGVLLVWKKLFRGHRKLVVTLHMDPVGTGWFKIVYSIERFILRALLTSADTIRVSSHRMTESTLLLGLAQKVQVIPFGVDLTRFHAGEKTAYPVFMFVGRLSRTHYFKGVKLLLRAFRTAHAARKDAELWIVGDGEERVRYEELARSLKIAPHVKFLGAVSDEDLPGVYRKASALVLPSIDTSETFGLVLLEAMASGVPVIASRLPGVDALVQEGITGALVTPGSESELTDALSGVLQNYTAWLARASVARARAEEYGDWKTIASQIQTLLY